MAVTFGERLQILMDARGVTQAQLAAASGVAQPTISRYKTGDVQNMPHRIVVALERALGVPPGALSVDPVPGPSLQRFLDSDLARALQPPLSEPERLMLTLTGWYANGEEPTIAAWYQLVLARRSLQTISRP